MALCGLYYITAITFISNNFSIFLNIQNNLLFCQTDKKNMFRHADISILCFAC
ncbi:MAG: hypothetical protein SCABRO_03552 [Candidatus Scalindua brodae]|uniref:Uncharacterized protein n=1 Tax=Candidatus Scalindua brodae TaxID=237368 RepID=A0A0B0EBP1_9BACT|nr:MAG: hypothetical protein SCABRO_03552 [Candidatus Scalindua brodae]